MLQCPARSRTVRWISQIQPQTVQTITANSVNKTRRPLFGPVLEVDSFEPDVNMRRSSESTLRFVLLGDLMAIDRVHSLKGTIMV